MYTQQADADKTQAADGSQDLQFDPAGRPDAKSQLNNNEPPVENIGNRVSVVGGAGDKSIKDDKYSLSIN